jgi:hypothetical protein
MQDLAKTSTIREQPRQFTGVAAASWVWRDSPAERLNGSPARDAVIVVVTVHSTERSPGVVPSRLSNENTEAAAHCTWAERCVPARVSSSTGRACENEPWRRRNRSNICASAGSVAASAPHFTIKTSPYPCIRETMRLPHIAAEQEESYQLLSNLDSRVYRFRLLDQHASGVALPLLSCARTTAILSSPQAGGVRMGHPKPDLMHVTILRTLATGQPTTVHQTSDYDCALKACLV